MEGQGVAASAASEAGRHSEPGAGAIAGADFDDPGVTHVTSDTTGGGEGQRQNGDDTLVIPALGRPEAPGSGTAVPFTGPAEALPPPPGAANSPASTPPPVSEPSADQSPAVQPPPAQPAPAQPPASQPPP